MKAFSNLLSDLILTSSRNRKLSLLEQYFSSIPDPDRGYALAALTGSLNFKNIKSSFFKDLIKEKQDEHLFDLSYDYVGDLAETISLLWDQEKGGNMPRLSSLFENLEKAKTDEIKNHIINILNISTADQRWAFIKLFTGGLRIGVSSRLVKQALANYGNVDLEEIEKIWHGLHFPYTNLFSWLENKGSKPKISIYDIFHPMMLAHPLVMEKDLAAANPKDFVAEYKWDGIRVQIVSHSEGCRLYSRTGDEVSKSFPEIIKTIQGNFVLDGELLAGINNDPKTFNDLQQRLNKKAPSEKFIEKNPCFIKVYDVLFFNGDDLRDKTLIERKKVLSSFFSTNRSPMFLSETIEFKDWRFLDKIRDISNKQIHEGVMIKSVSSPYIAGRPRGKWFKWKRNPKNVDAIIMYAQRGHGKRSSFYSDYTFGVFNKEKELVPIGKAYSGFTDEELNRLDKFVRSKTINRFGPVREVEKTLVVEIAFDEMSLSHRHKSGIALRFPRFKRIRWDKPTNEVETLEQIRKNFLE